MTQSKPKTLLLLKPRGFCAGVVRAIDIVRIALETFGAPIYVRKEIVHNRYVVDELSAKGAIFVDSVGEVPAGWLCLGLISDCDPVEALVRGVVTKPLPGPGAKGWGRCG